jgi:repressor LexA
MNINLAVFRLRKFFKSRKRLPSYGEMRSIFGFSSKNACFKLVKKLIDEQILAKDSKGRLVPRKLFPPLPILGVIKAGSPTMHEQQFMESLSFDDYLVGNFDKSYLLRVSGDSMIDAGIYEGDLVVVEKEKEAKNGDVVVACIDGEFTLKYFRKEKNSISLVAANKKYPAIQPKENLTIFGIVVSVVRKYR